MDDEGMEKADSDEHINPVVPDTLDTEDTELLRGDAIGDTAYTHRWVLSCLLTIIKNLPKYLRGLESAGESGDGGSSTLSKSDQHSWRQAVMTKDANNTSHDSTTSIDAILSSNRKNNELPMEKPEQAKSKKSSEENLSAVDKDMSSDSGTASKSSEEKGNEDVLELDEDVEEAACQLWDMTVEKDVVLHLLNLEELNVLQLASQILSHSKAPRLTEVVTGIVANLCCQKEGCDMVLQDRNGVLEAMFEMLLTTSDVPTLCEVIRLIKLLLWHRLNRTPAEDRSTCPLLLALQEKPISEAIIFLISNCLNDNLIKNLLELLESLLFVKLSHQTSGMADYYATIEMVDSLVDIFKKNNASSLENFGKIDEEVHLHKSLVCLYAFVDTSIITVLQERERKNDYILSDICSYIEKWGNTNSQEELMQETSEKLVSALGLCQILIPCLRHGRVIRAVAHLLALTRGDEHHYTASRSNSTEDDAMHMDGDPGWLSPVVTTQSNNTAPVSRTLSEENCRSELQDLDDSLCDYCGELFSWWWQQDKTNKNDLIRISLLKKLDECHANEVILVFKAVRSRKPDIVSLLQEYLLDKGAHSRLVQLLAHMYQ